MELQRPSVDTLRMVTSAVVGASGPEIVGGEQDGDVAPFIVVAQVEVAPLSQATEENRLRTEVMHLALSKAAALDVARQLEAAAALLED